LEEKMNEEINVKKRNGGIEPLQLSKLHEMVQCACEDLSGVSVSQVEMASGIQFYDGISTNEIQEILIKSASDLISLEHPNYQYVAARLLLFSIRKKIYGGRIDLPHLAEHIKKCVDLGVYDSAIYDNYTEEELDEANSFIDHDRDLLFTYAGLRQVVDKYLVQDRVDNVLYETPQFMYLLIALTGFAKYPKDKRMSYVKRYYDAISKHKINIPTPILAGVRTKLRQYSSCVLVDVADSLSSIEASDAAVFRYVAQRAGLGINAGRWRGINSKIRGGEVVHTGVIPYLKKFEATVKSCTQNGIRGGSSTVFFPVWHQEIEDIIVLKNNKGSEDNRVRNLDYAIQLSKIFYERFIQDGEITLFSPHNVPGLYEKFGLEGFDELYVKYENDPSIPKKKVKAQELIIDILKERAETGRIYLMNIDHCNSHSPFKDQITMSNLCMEILLKTTPIEHIDDVNGSIALCILSCVNVGAIKSDRELEEYCDLSVRFLDELIDHQQYPVKAAELTTKASRSLGIGYIGLAHYLAKLGFKYSDPGAWEAVHKLTESFQYYLLKSSNNLAKEKGACDNFKHTKYSDGILPIDTYKKEVDEICNVKYTHDWEQLRQDILEYGLRHTTLSSQPPTESSSVSCNATNGVEPPRDYLSIKQSKKGTLKQIVPQYNKLKNNYTLLWDMPSNEGYINCVSVMQKFFDQGISVNTSYNPQNYQNNEVPISVLVNDVLSLYKYGAKTAYYHNTYDGKTDDVSAEEIKNNDLISEILSSEEECIACNV
jgi:ribonucleoside-diphosphate reductase alpha chain